MVFNVAVSISRMEFIVSSVNRVFLATCVRMNQGCSQNRRLFYKTDCVSFDTFDTFKCYGLYIKGYSYVEPDVHRQQLYPSLKYISLKRVTMEISDVLVSIVQ